MGHTGTLVSQSHERAIYSMCKLLEVLDFFFVLSIFISLLPIPGILIRQVHIICLNIISII